MKKLKCTLMKEDGSIDFVQLIVGLMIISIATIGTFESLFYGYEQLDFQMRYRKALSIARGQVEYWQGRIHTDFPSGVEMAGSLRDPKVMLLDERDPTTGRDNIDCEVAHNPLVERFQNEAQTISYWEIQVIVTWYEPGKSEDDGNSPNKIVLLAPMVPSAL